MSAVPGIIREVQEGGIVVFNNKNLQHDELRGYVDSDVELELEIDVSTEKSCFRVYTMFEDEICVIELDEVKSIEEAVKRI